MKLTETPNNRSIRLSAWLSIVVESNGLFISMRHASDLYITMFTIGLYMYIVQDE